MSRNRKTKKAPVPESRARSLLKKPWLFAGAAFGLDIAMLIAGMALSKSNIPIKYTVNGSDIEKTDPLAFFGVIAAAVIGVVCVLVGLMIGGAFLKRHRPAQIMGAVGLLMVSLAMVGSSAYMALGSPIKAHSSVSYSDEEVRLIIEETQPYFGKSSVAFYLTGKSDEGKAVLLAASDLNEYGISDDRYTVNWVSDSTLMVSFQDGINYRQITIPADKSKIEN